MLEPLVATLGQAYTRAFVKQQSGISVHFIMFCKLPATRTQSYAAATLAHKIVCLGLRAHCRAEVCSCHPNRVIASYTCLHVYHVCMCIYIYIYIMHVIHVIMYMRVYMCIACAINACSASRVLCSQGLLHRGTSSVYATMLHSKHVPSDMYTYIPTSYIL